MDAFDIMLGAVANERYHSVLVGKVANGPAELTLTKTCKTPLSPGNPTGQEAVEEKLKMTMTTDRNGQFEWHVPPSSRPYEKKAESYTLTIKSGGKTKTIKVQV